MIDLKFGGTFCALPWIEEYQSNDGKKGFCCIAKNFSDSDDPKILREMIWNGQKISHCSFCYESETKKIISLRQKESIRWLKSEKKHFDQKECPEQKILFYDIRIDNKCNLACITCQPRDSSLWEKELKMIPKNNIYDFDYEKMMTAKKIYLSGGEPLIIDKYIHLIKYIANNNPEIELSINTNLTNLPNDVLESFKKIKSLNITVSVDAMKKVNEYHRYPLKWDKFLRNLENINKINATLRFNTVVDAVSIFGMSDFKELENYNIKEWELSILKIPENLPLQNIPDRLKKLAIKCAENLKNIKFYKTDPIFKSKVHGIIEEIKKDGDPHLLAEYINDLDHRRKINHEDYLGVKLT